MVVGAPHDRRESFERPNHDEDVVTPIDWEYDLPDRVDDQLAWLRDAGLDAEAVWSYKDLAVMRATRPQRPG